MNRKSDYMVNYEDISIQIETIEQKRAEQVARMKEYMDRIVMEKSGTIVDQLIEERKRQGLTQKDIAIRTGVATSNIARFELKKTVPTLQFFEKYAKAVGKEMKYTLE